MLRRLAELDDEVGPYATLALRELAPVRADRRCTDGHGLRIAQLTTVGGLDDQLRMGGRGEIGGVASLLVSLGQALAGRPEVGHVLTIGRGTIADALAGTPPST